MTSNLADSIPRSDISADTNKAMTLMRDKNWKKKKEGLDKLEALFTANS